MRYAAGRVIRAKHINVTVCFNSRVGGVLEEGVMLAALLDKCSSLDLANGQAPGLPQDVAAKISIRIEVLTITSPVKDPD